MDKVTALTLVDMVASFNNVLELFGPVILHQFLGDLGIPYERRARIVTGLIEIKTLDVRMQDVAINFVHALEHDVLHETIMRFYNDLHSSLPETMQVAC
jgi:hypothetical protein